MKVKALMEILQEFDPEQEVVFLELSDFYDTILLRISEHNDRVEIIIKNIEKQDEGLLQ
jgi:hypothetical protein